MSEKLPCFPGIQIDAHHNVDMSARDGHNKTFHFLPKVLGCLGVVLYKVRK